MQQALVYPPPESFDSGSNPPFNVVIAYEDLETGKHAKRTYDFLVEELGHDCEFSNQMWKFDVLSLPKLREIASADAAAADIVVISCHGDELPAQVKSWIESWVDGDDTPLALVALFDPLLDRPVRTRAARSYLALVARRGHMEFFAQPDEWPGRREPQEEPGEQDALDFHHRTLFTLAGALKREIKPPRWTFPD